MCSGLIRDTVPSESNEYDKLIAQASSNVNTEKAVVAAGTTRKRKGQMSECILTQPEIAFIHLGIQISREQCVKIDFTFKNQIDEVFSAELR